VLFGDTTIVGPAPQLSPGQAFLLLVTTLYLACPGQPSARKPSPQLVPLHLLGFRAILLSPGPEMHIAALVPRPSLASRVISLSRARRAHDSNLGPKLFLVPSEPSSNLPGPERTGFFGAMPSFSAPGHLLQAGAR